MQQSLGCREAIYCVPTAGKRHLCRGGSTMGHRWNGFLLVALPHRKILPFCLDKQRGSMVNSYVLSFLFYSSKSAFSRHGIVQASLPLFIWLIKDGLSTACISLHRAYTYRFLRGRWLQLQAVPLHGGGVLLLCRARRKR